jgi:multimeric flavodoxin WrbA
MTSAIVLFASSRRNGNTGQLIDQLAELIELEMIDLSELRIAEYDYDHKNRGDDFEKVMDRVLSFEKVIFASPIYWYSATPKMKAFLDRITDYLDLEELKDKGRMLRGKTAYVACTSLYPEVDDSFLGMFQKTFHYLGLNFGGCLHADCGNGYNKESYAVDLYAFIASLSAEGAKDNT